MGRHNGTSKTCNRCGRTGSHAFRRTPDGLYECTTTTACRARSRRSAGSRQDGRGRLPKQRGSVGTGPGVAYVIGEPGGTREVVCESLRDVTDLAVAAGTPSKSTLTALGSRNVKLMAVAAEALESIGFRNEFALRCRQPKLSAVPVFLYGSEAVLEPAVLRTLSTSPVPHADPTDVEDGLRRRLEAFVNGESPDGALTPT